MKIGDIATAAGVPTATVRFYERRGLLPKAPRTPAGYRKYGGDAALRLQFIKHAQELGFSLEEIHTMLALRTDDPAACRAVEALARAKVQTVREHLRELRRLERMLSSLVRRCEQPHAPASCPVLELLAKPSSRRSPPAPRIKRA